MHANSCVAVSAADGGVSLHAAQDGLLLASIAPSRSTAAAAQQGGTGVAGLAFLQTQAPQQQPLLVLRYCSVLELHAVHTSVTAASSTNSNTSSISDTRRSVDLRRWHPSAGALGVVASTGTVAVASARSVTVWAARADGSLPGGTWLQPLRVIDLLSSSSNSSISAGAVLSLLVPATASSSSGRSSSKRARRRHSSSSNSAAAVAVAEEDEQSLLRALRLLYSGVQASPAPAVAMAVSPCGGRAAVLDLAGSVRIVLLSVSSSSSNSSSSDEQQQAVPLVQWVGRADWNSTTSGSSTTAAGAATAAGADSHSSAQQSDVSDHVVSVSWWSSRVLAGVTARGRLLFKELAVLPSTSTSSSSSSSLAADVTRQPPAQPPPLGQGLVLLCAGDATRAVLLQQGPAGADVVLMESVAASAALARKLDAGLTDEALQLADR
jgi:hypothetical protein